MQGCDAGQKVGYAKIKRFCDVAAADGFEFVWVDTCCIDKTSSSELSEAINSMYRWYREAEVCYVYLSDVLFSEDPHALKSAFKRSRWFTRGWTLQELIAPSSVIFFSSEWKEVGTKSSLREILSKVTGIHAPILLGDKLDDFSVAQRMSWASKRKTTRVEDLAYCLIGIFGVNMPMLYGEGERAFNRLQEEIMKISDDHTIFAWKASAWWEHDGGLLAFSPAAFTESRNIIQFRHRYHKPFALTNKGIILRVPLKRLDNSEAYVAILDCQDLGESSCSLGIRLRDISEDMSEPRTSLDERSFERNCSHQLETMKPADRINCTESEIYVRQKHRQKVTPSYSQFFIRISGVESHGIVLSESYPIDWVQRDGKISSLTRLCDMVGALRFTKSYSESFVVLLKMKNNILSANIDIYHDGQPETVKDIFWSFDASSVPSNRRRVWNDVPDRILWQHPQGMWWVCVAIKRQIIDGERKLVVDIGLR